MHLLELFSGTGSGGRAFERKGWTVTSVDLDERSRPSICCDVLDLDVEVLRLRGLVIVDLIWASPPCTHYSRARSKAKTPRDLEGSDKLVRKVLELSAELQCPFLMENPHSGLLKTRDVVQGIPCSLVDYCKYKAPYRKRTGIWTNTDWRPERPLCKHDCTASVGKKHTRRAQRSSFDLATLYSLPEELCEELARWATEHLGRRVL
jgi:hypothetical protein